MQQMEWRNGKSQPKSGLAFLSRILLSRMRRMTPVEFAKQELQAMQCKWCADGFPLFAGVHDVLGVPVPCDAMRERSDETSQAQRFLNTLGRLPELRPAINAYRCSELVKVKSYRALPMETRAA